MQKKHEEQNWTNLFIKNGRAMLFAGNGAEKESLLFYQDGDTLQISLDESKKYSITIPGGSSFSFAEGSIFEGHNVAGQTILNPSEMDAMLCYNEDMQTLILQPLESVGCSICLVNDLFGG